MAEAAVSMVVLDGDKILLAKRDDIEMWTLPGGGVDAGESVAQAEVREVKEETGLDVRIDTLVGVYSRIGVLPDVHIIVFSGETIGGKIKCQPGETIDVKFFPIDDLPENLVPGSPQRIKDAIVGKSGSVAVKQILTTSSRLELSKEELTNIQKQPREKRIEMFGRYFGDPKMEIEVEVG